MVTITASSTLNNALRELTFQLHAHLEALLKATVGTSLTLTLVNVAAALCDARVDLLILNGSLEEALAGLAGEQAVVVAGDAVAAHRTLLLDALLRITGGRTAGHRHHRHIRQRVMRVTAQ